MRTAAIICFVLAAVAFLVGNSGLVMMMLGRPPDMNPMSRNAGILAIPALLCALGVFLWRAGTPYTMDEEIDEQIVDEQPPKSLP